MSAAQQPRAVFLLFACAILWSLGGVLLKVVEWHPLAIAGGRGLIAGLFLLAWVRKPKFTWSRTQVGAAIAYTACTVLFAAANKTDAAATRVDESARFPEFGNFRRTNTSMSSIQSHDTRELVVLLHGVGMTPWFMKPIARHLESEGYRVLNIGYPSRTVPIEELAGLWLPVRLSDPLIAAAPRVHFVGHSMGSLLVRHFMANSRPENAGRVVMIAPPNQGSELADMGSPRWLVRWFVGVNLDALGMSEDAFWRELPQSVDYPTGIIAGTGEGNPIGRKLPKPHDGTVPVPSTRIAGSTDSIELPWSHTGILFHRRTPEEVAHFLRHGRFNHAGAENPASSGS